MQNEKVLIFSPLLSFLRIVFNFEMIKKSTKKKIAFKVKKNTLMVFEIMEVLKINLKCEIPFSSFEIICCFFAEKKREKGEKERKKNRKKKKVFERRKREFTFLVIVPFHSRMGIFHTFKIFLSFPFLQIVFCSLFIFFPFIIIPFSLLRVGREIKRS